MPVINACVPFCSKLQDAVNRGLKNQTTIESAIDFFREMVNATKVANITREGLVARAYMST